MVNVLLLSQTTEHLGQINQQIKAIEREARRKGVNIYDMRAPDGTWIMPNLLVAKAQTLNTIARLRVSD